MHSKFDDEAFHKNPEQFGFCTFDEFRKNKSKWLQPKDHLLQMVDKGSTAYKMSVREQRYYLDGYRCDSLESLETLAGSMGQDVRKLKMAGIVREKGTAGKWILNIHFMSPENFEKRKDW